MNGIQECYPEDSVPGYGCRRLNRDGLHVRTWDGDQTEARFTPRSGAG